MRNLVTVFTGLIFGIGLIMSGMTNPAKVQNFLDIFGSWDPSLALVMGGAILITMPGFWLVQKRQTPFFEDAFLIPQKTLGKGKLFYEHRAQGLDDLIASTKRSTPFSLTILPT